MSRNSKSNDILTPRHKAKVGERVKKGSEMVALVKQGNKKDTISVEEFAQALYGPDYQCVIIPPPEYK